MNYFLSNFSEWKRKNIKQGMTLEPSYFYWCNTLLEYAINIFEWSGLPDTIPQHEIEMGLYSHGYTTIVRLSNGKFISPYENSRSGITDYYDIFTKVNFTTPLHYGTRTIGKDAVLICNNSLKMSLLPKIQRYATLLAHTDVSITCELVNDRESKLFEAINGKMADKCNYYQNRLYNGEFETIVNLGLEGIKVTELNKRSNNEVERLIVVRNKLIQSYLEEIGIKKTSEKKERMISDEASGDSEMLKYNIKDMLDCRKKSAEEMNQLWGWNVSIKSNINMAQEKY